MVCEGFWVEYLILQGSEGNCPRDSEASPHTRLHILQLNVQQHVLNTIISRIQSSLREEVTRQGAVGPWTSLPLHLPSLCCSLQFHLHPLELRHMEQLMMKRKEKTDDQVLHVLSANKRTSNNDDHGGY